MHIDDAHDDKIVADSENQPFKCTVTRVQARAAQAVPTIIEPAPSSPSQDLITKPIEHLTESVMPSRSDQASTSTTDEITIQNNIIHFSELAIARALLKHSVEFILPPHYKPDVTGKMRVVGMDGML